jgi:hypothetical protein
MIRPLLAALAACLVVPSASAGGVFQPVSAFYSLDAFAGLSYTDGLTNSDPGPQAFTISDQGPGYAVQAGVSSNFNTFLDSITLTANAFSITRAGSDDQVETTTEQSITFDLLVDAQATLRSFNLGWRAITSNNGAAVCSTVLADASGGNAIVREAPDAFEFFTEVVNLPAGRYTWSLFGYTGSDDGPGYPDFTQHSASLNAILELRFTPGFGQCNAADLADPRNLLDLADITAFVTAFGDQLEAGDLNADGVFDLADVVIFVTAFNAGCP